MDYPIRHDRNRAQTARLRLLIDPNLQFTQRCEHSSNQRRVFQCYPVTPFHGDGKLQSINGIQAQAVRAEERLVGADILGFDAEQGILDQDNPQIIEGCLIFCHKLTNKLLITA